MSAEYDTLCSIMDRRYSCRAFLAKPVAPEDIQKIVRAAGRVPSWCNAQPWSTIITQGAETDCFRTMLKDAFASSKPEPDFDWPTAYEGPYQERRREAGWQLYGSVGIQKGDREGAARQSARNFALFDAPHVATIHAPRALGPNVAVDIGGYVTAFTLAAASLGIASIPQAAIAAYAPEIRNHFDLSDDRLIVAAISFGYEDAAHPANGFRTSRAHLDEILDLRGKGTNE